MNIRNLGWKWNLVLLAALVVGGLLFHAEQPALAQSFVNADISSLVGLEIKNARGNSPFAVRLDQGSEKGLPVRIEGSIDAESAAIAVDGTSAYVVKGSKVFLLDKGTLNITKTVDLPTTK